MNNHCRAGRVVWLRSRAVLLALAALPSFSIAQERTPWEWTIEQRLDARFDPIRIRERDEAYVAKYRAAHPELRADKDRAPHTGMRYRIDGARNPELFLPHELFDHLLRGVTSEAGMRSRMRQNSAADLKAAGFDPNSFWPALESLSAQYLPLMQRQGSQSRGDHYEKCHARYAALQSARKWFGPTTFDRMLYTVIASKTDFSVGTSFPNPKEDLRREANGCEGSRD
jgi:hypothetical protein